MHKGTEQKSFFLQMLLMVPSNMQPVKLVPIFHFLGKLFSVEAYLSVSKPVGCKFQMTVPEVKDVGNFPQVTFFSSRFM